jgi:hypothetical protein
VSAPSKKKKKKEAEPGAESGAATDGDAPSKKKKKEEPPGVSYQPDKGLVWNLKKDYRLRLDAMAQLEATNDPDAVEAGKSFFPRRLRLTLRAKLSDWVDLKSSLDAAPLLNVNAGDEDDDGEVFADQTLSVNLSKDAAILVGYFRGPFGRQRLNSSSALLLPDRSQVTGQLTFDRGLGLGFQGERGKKGFLTYGAAINADLLLAQQKNLAPVPVVTARVALNPRGEFEDEGPLKPADEARYSFGVNGAVPVSASNDLASPSLGIDAAFEVGRFSGLAEALVRTRQIEEAQVVNGAAVGVPNGDTQAQPGLYGQLGFLVWPERVQVGARAGVLAPDPNLNQKLNTQGRKTELSAALNLFFWERRAMLQAQAARFVEAADETHGENRETILSVQLQTAL